MKMLTLLGLALTLAWPAAGQNADDYRGGWRTDGGDPHVYEFSIRGDRVRGVYCTRCSDATTLAFLDGTFGADGITFVVTHVKSDGSTAYREQAVALLSDRTLLVSGTSERPGDGRFERKLIKDPRGPDPLTTVPVSMLPAGPPVQPGPRLGGGPELFQGTAWEQPGPWKRLTIDDVVGVWLGFRVGLNKQYFIIRRFGNGLRGIACGRCDNPYTLAMLDDFVISENTLTFYTLHEDWGPGALPFRNKFIAHITQNEMRFATQQDNTPEPAEPRFGSSLVGPIAIEATVGNN
jgi:hypothetical protein